jgi:hypothetical protein
MADPEGRSRGGVSDQQQINANPCKSAANQHKSIAKRNKSTANQRKSTQNNTKQLQINADRRKQRKSAANQVQIRCKSDANQNVVFACFSARRFAMICTPKITANQAPSASKKQVKTRANHCKSLQITNLEKALEKN